MARQNEKVSMMQHSADTARAAHTQGFFQGSAARSCVIEARGLRKAYGSAAKSLRILDGVDLQVEEGELVAIVGPSGAGKSTLLHLLAALDTPTSGTVYFAGEALETLSEEALADFRNRSIGFVWQRHHLLPDFTAGENVAMPLLMRGVARREALRQSDHWLEQVGLTSRTNHRAGELSGGEQQRTAIARALVNNPAVLLADEPTGDLDEQNAEAIFDLMQRLHRTHRLTSLIATHNSGLSRRCDRVLGLEHGHLVPRTAGAGHTISGEAGANFGGESS
jgi:lipoprotein-releasing system ATP-binding protein